MFLLRRAVLQSSLSKSTSRCFSSKQGSNGPVAVLLRPSARPVVSDVLRVTFNSDKATFSSAQIHRDSAEDFGADAIPESRASNTRFGSGQGSGQGSGRTFRSFPPSRTVYVGNLFFSVAEKDLEREMSRMGKVERVKIIYDPRGLSKGFAFVQYAELESAERAVQELAGQYFEGRPLTIQYGKSEPVPPNPNRAPNPPGKTLFIGNMSFEMSDRDLNDLFRDIRNVVDVRVAIDRRTGQPRGFAHADFTDVESAIKAKEILSDKQIFERKLRVDFSASTSPSGQNSQPAERSIKSADDATETETSNIDAQERTQTA